MTARQYDNTSFLQRNTGPERLGHGVMSISAKAGAFAARGDALLGQGRLGEAIASYRAALATDTHMPTTWYNLGWALRADRQFEDALVAYDTALQTGIDAPEAVHLNKAAILSDHLYRTDEALSASRRAVELAPHFTEAWLNLGHLLEDIGDVAAARDAYAHAIATAPTSGSANARLAHLDVRAGDTNKVISQLEDVLARTHDPSDRAEMLFALGHALDAEERYRPAFKAYRDANALAAALAPRRYDPAGQERFTAEMIAAFREPPTIRAQGASTPVFICGMFRSGSTLLEYHLGRHAGFLATGERELIPAFAAAIDHYPAGWAALGEQTRLAFENAYLAPFKGIDRILIDKRCDNFQHIGLIKSVFPNAKFINTVRSPLDNLLSVFFLNFSDGVSYANEIHHSAHYYVEYLKMMKHWKRLFPNDIYDFHYEEFLKDPDAELKDVAQFLGVDLDNGLLVRPPAEEVQPIRTPSAWQVRQKLHTRSIGRASHYREELGSIAEYLAQAGVVLLPRS
jgi:tetratricopeptide (TPR) repeat protein